MTIHKSKGISLIEVVIFIVVIGIIGATIPRFLFVASKGIGGGVNNADAYNLAVSRMQIILGQRAINGYSTTAKTLNICCPASSSGQTCTETPTSNSGIAVCDTIPTGYAITTTITSPPSGSACNPTLPSGANANNYACVTVQVTGLAGAAVSTLISNY